MIFENDEFLLEFENSEIPWVKIFTKTPYKELSDVPENTRNRLFQIAMLCEKEMLNFYKADKINWASFANYVPKVHLHIQARFKDDSFYPESMWGVRQRDGAKRDLRSHEFGRILAEKIAGILD